MNINKKYLQCSCQALTKFQWLTNGQKTFHDVAEPNKQQ